MVNHLRFTFEESHACIRASADLRKGQGALGQD